MSTSRALKPIFGPGRRLLFDQLAPQPRRKFVPSRPSTSVCSSCRHGQVLGLGRAQLRFFSSDPPKPPNGGDTGEKNATPEQQREPPLVFHFPPPASSPPEPPQPDPAKAPPPDPEPTPQPSQPPPSPPPPDSSTSSSDSSSTSTSTSSSTSTPNPDLPSTQNSRRSNMNRQLSAFMDRAQTTLFAASQRINDLTGYSGIEVLKSQISALESSLASAQANLHAARSAYKTAVSSRSATQREVTTLLARQKTWSPADFERFTALYRQDYELEASVHERAAELEDAEREAERLGRELSAGILSRYHEEQIWSDKIRRMSTWGTWGLMGVNILLFLVLQFGAEPWRRRRLVKGFEEKVREAMEEERRLEREIRRQEAEIETMRRREELAAATAAAPVTVEAVAEGEPSKAGKTTAAEPEEQPTESFIRIDMPPKVPWREFFSDPDYWKDIYAELSSDRKVFIKVRDVSILALESAAAGAAVVGTIATILLIRRT
ncbi:Mdm33 family-domain-containing protein [Annulohypoxylon truncatum]|uniref:Mdm33 family-domain-containing protein n=1 Tax=Annulohypoxylon truncatum TaxID=327061 RepID=UPI002008B1E6|nr:Mdm33 family-domain-containing protein [Annulohypoxylon truncatum]KAI1208331.1 Mdm33 family-domain-containing protein [Annulohypoxylon truncatum]